MADALTVEQGRSSHSSGAGGSRQSRRLSAARSARARAEGRATYGRSGGWPTAAASVAANCPGQLPPPPPPAARLRHPRGRPAALSHPPPAAAAALQHLARVHAPAGGAMPLRTCDRCSFCELISIAQSCSKALASPATRALNSAAIAGWAQRTSAAGLALPLQIGPY